MEETNIKSLNNLVEQGGSIVDLAKDFGKTIDDIYALYDVLRERWTGEKSDEYKKKIDELRDPLKVIIGTVSRQGEAVQSAGEAFQKFERV